MAAPATVRERPPGAGAERPPALRPGRARPPAAPGARRASRRELLAARVALAALALHLVDDAFLQPEPGTSAGDHLASGLLVPAALATLALALPRLGAAARGLALLWVGLCAFAAGILVPVRSVALGGPSGDDFSGLLATAAGAVLVALGAAELWRSRRRDERRPRRYARRGLIAVAAAIAAFWLLVPIPFAWLATHKPRVAVEPVELGRAAEPVSFETADGLRLAGLYVPSRNGAAVIAFPGRSGPARHARMLARHGYGVLVLDRRGEGASEGDPNALGYGGAADLAAAAAYLERRPDVEAGRVGGLGLSVGGELMIEAAARGAALDAVVSEGAGIRSYREQLDFPDAGRWASVPFWVSASAATAVLGNESVPPGLTELAARAGPRPLFLIWTRHGNSEQLNRVLVEAAGPHGRIWEIPAAGHTGGLSARPAAYERRVVGFFDRALLGPRGRPGG